MRALHKTAGFISVLMVQISPISAEGVNAGVAPSIESGEAGARAGTTLYNSINPATPLPESSNNVVPDTVRNMGSGQSAKDAWKNAAELNAGKTTKTK